MPDKSEEKLRLGKGESFFVKSQLRRLRRKMQVKLLGNEYEVVVEEYDRFGESAFEMKLKKVRKRKG